MIEDFRAIQGGLNEVKAFAQEMKARLSHISSCGYQPALDEVEGYDPYIAKKDLMVILFADHFMNEASFQLEVFNNLVDRMDVVGGMIFQQNEILKQAADIKLKEGLVQDHVTFGDLFTRSNELYGQYIDTWLLAASRYDDPAYLNTVIKFEKTLQFYSDNNVNPAFSVAASSNKPASLHELTKLRLDYATSCYQQSMISMSFCCYITDRSRYILKVMDDGMMDDESGELNQNAQAGLTLAQELVDQSFKNIRSIEKFLARVYDADPDPDADIAQRFDPKRLEYVPLNLNI